MMEKQSEIITSRNLLYGFLDLKSMAPNPTVWSEENFSDNPPRLIRLRRLIALFRAYNIPWNLASFISGHFIDIESMRYADLLDRITTDMQDYIKHDSDTELMDIESGFATLLEYRQTVDRLLTFFSGHLSWAFGLGGIIQYRAVEFNKIIRNNVDILDDLICYFISPEGSSFSLEDMIHEHGYPDADLDEIDLDWL